jgi:two-component system, cell cycle response regulator DivK
MPVETPMRESVGDHPAPVSGTRRDPSPTSHVHQDDEPAASVLIAEDHPDSREALRSLLEVYGYRVHTAIDGREAIDKALALQPDLILMDIMMPHIDGFEATRRLRAAETFRQVPIIALTAMDGAREMVLAAGCDDYLGKPIDVRTFLERVRLWAEAGRNGY